MKVLMTGATGLIGTALGPELVGRGHRLVVLTRDPDRARVQLPFPCEIYPWLDAATSVPADALAGVDGVIHLAGEPVTGQRWTSEKKKRIRASRVLGTRVLVEALSASVPSPRVFVQASGIGYYGDRGDEVVSEEAAPGDDFLAQVAVDWEGEGRKIESCGARWVALRTGVVLAAQGGALKQMLPFFKAGIGGRIGSGRQWMSWIHLDDIVGLYAHALESEAVHGALNACSPFPVRNEEFARELARALGTQALLPVPGFALKLIFGELGGVLLGGQKASAEAAQRSGFKFRHERLAPAFQDLFGGREKTRGKFG